MNIINYVMQLDCLRRWVIGSYTFSIDRNATMKYGICYGALMRNTDSSNPIFDQYCVFNSVDDREQNANRVRFSVCCQYCQRLASMSTLHLDALH